MEFILHIIVIFLINILHLPLKGGKGLNDHSLLLVLKLISFLYYLLMLRYLLLHDAKLSVQVNFLPILPKCLSKSMNTMQRSMKSH